MSDHKRIFISYSWDSETHKKQVFDFSQQLRQWGLETLLDQYHEVEHPAQGWPQWTLDQIEIADFVLMVCTETYHRWATGKEIIRKGKRVTWEGNVIKNEIFHANFHNTKFIPVLFNTQDINYIPNFVLGIDPYILDDPTSLTHLYRQLTQQKRVEAQNIGPIIPLPLENQTQFNFDLNLKK